MIKIFITVFCFSCMACAVMRNVYYVTDKQQTSATGGHLLFGIDSQNWKTPWKINNVAQYEDSNLIFTLALNHHYYRYWATGVWIIPLVPLFGIKSYLGSMEGVEKSRLIKVALYSKNKQAITLNPCNIDIKPARQVISYSYFHKDSVKLAEKCSEITITDWTDIPIFDLNLNEDVGVEELSVNVKGLKQNGREISIPMFQFKPDNGFEWTSWL